MAMTITEKILAAHSGKKSVFPGKLIEADVSLILANDITAPMAIDEFEKVGGKLFNPEKIVLVPDHFTPNKDLKSAAQCLKLRDFVKKNKVKHYFEVGRGGIEHVLLPDEGLVLPGDLIIGADSHTCTYGAVGAFATGVGSTDIAAAMITGKVWLKVPETIKLIYHGKKLKKWVTGKDLILHTIRDIGVEGANYQAMEFCGEMVSRLDMAARFTMANMAIEAGAENGIFEVDKKTTSYLNSTPAHYRQEIAAASDPDASYCKRREYDCEALEPQVAAPPLPSNARPVLEFTDVRIDQALIGSCTNGRIEDLRLAAEVLSGRKTHPDVRLIIIPATQKVYLQALKEGLIEIFISSNGVVSTPTCGPCLGGHMGILARGEVAIATTNRNFIGRMGHLESKVYLANPAITAASAIKGRIAHPDEV